MVGRKKNTNQILKEKQEMATETSETAHKSCLTEEILKSHLETLEKSITNNLGKIIAELQDKLEQTQDIAAKALKLAEDNSKQITHLSNENTNLKTRLRTLENEKIYNIEEQIESRTNRQLRKTLVFKGIPETQPGENNKKETWEETEDIVAKQIAEICDDTTLQNARDMLERCHRAKENTNYQGHGPRPIFCALFSWKESEYVKQQFRKNNLDNPNSKVYCEQKYGPRTTVRRNQAMMLRKQLKMNNQITSGYVAFPARLMVKYTGNRDERYICKRDFSKEEVKFTR